MPQGNDLRKFSYRLLGNQFPWGKPQNLFFTNQPGPYLSLAVKSKREWTEIKVIRLSHRTCKTLLLNDKIHFARRIVTWWYKRYVIASYQGDAGKCACIKSTFIFYTLTLYLEQTINTTVVKSLISIFLIVRRVKL